ncbi:MAG: DNA-binding transcriptional regulator [Roseateles depolymerans]|uniref:DNA-binding transcriptional regulator n=1 Tax=Roseateles depolymerans TaxID=76731 RepID=A0A2W5DE53_9BURK|nr:MAG: DNA-binding transcriptional regulator [Roseateles depolymerans]
MTKISIERMTKIVRLIRKKGAAPKAYLLEQLEISDASLKRDIEFLRVRMGCPLDWDRSKRGYVIRDELAEGGKFELPGVWFDSSEVFALLAMLHLVAGVQPGLLEEHVGPLKSRLREMLAAGASSAKPIEHRLRLIHFAPRKVEPKHFQLIAGALLDGKRLHLVYWNRDRKERTERVISPQKLVHYRENWLLDSWCHEKNQLRSFALEAIESVRVVNEAAHEVSPALMQEHFRAGYGIFAGPAAHRARLKFTPERAQWVSKELWHHDQTSSFLPDGSYIMEVPYSNDQELVMDLMRHSPEVEVLAPPELRHRLWTALQAAAEKNRPEAVQ